MSVRHLCLVALVAILSAAWSEAQDAPIPIASVKGHVGAFQVTLTERSPLSKPADVAKRMSLKPAQAADDYNLSKEVFDVYVPKQPGADGKYGLMVAVHFEYYVKPPIAWPSVLDKYHLVWIGAVNNVDGREAAYREGLILDAAYNSQRGWPIDAARVYLCMCTGSSPTSLAALYYPDVFAGVLHSPEWFWFGKVRDTKTRGMWALPELPRPAPQLFNLARTHCRFFLADRKEDVDSGHSADYDILREGYLASGFKYAKIVTVPTAKLDHYANYSPDWFEQGIQFLDAPLAELAKQPQVAATEPAATTLGAAQPASAVQPSAAKAAGDLSMAKNYIAVQHYDAARTKLQKIIQTYPDTPEAKQAKDLLQDIQGK